MGRVFGWCTVLGLVLVLVWWGAYSSGLICGMSGRFFAISNEACALMNFGGIGLAKLLLYMFFLVPWLAIKFATRQRS